MIFHCKQDVFIGKMEQDYKRKAKKNLNDRSDDIQGSSSEDYDSNVSHAFTLFPSVPESLQGDSINILPSPRNYNGSDLAELYESDYFKEYYSIRNELMERAGNYFVCGVKIPKMLIKKEEVMDSVTKIVKADYPIKNGKLYRAHLGSSMEIKSAGLLRNTTATEGESFEEYLVSLFNHTATTGSCGGVMSLSAKKKVSQGFMDDNKSLVTINIDSFDEQVKGNFVSTPQLIIKYGAALLRGENITKDTLLKAIDQLGNKEYEFFFIGKFGGMRFGEIPAAHLIIDKKTELHSSVYPSHRYLDKPREAVEKHDDNYAKEIIRNGKSLSLHPDDLDAIKNNILSKITDSHPKLGDFHTANMIGEVISAAFEKSETFLNSISFGVKEKRPLGNITFKNEFDVITYASPHDTPAFSFDNLRNGKISLVERAVTGQNKSVININMAPNRNSHLFEAWALTLIHEMIHAITGAEDPPEHLLLQHLGPTEILTIDIMREMGLHTPEFSSYGDENRVGYLSGVQAKIIEEVIGRYDENDIKSLERRLDEICLACQSIEPGEASEEFIDRV